MSATKLPPLVRVGMPNAASRSQTTTHAPALATARAAQSPAGPPPATTTSYMTYPSSQRHALHLVGDELGDGERGGGGRRGCVAHRHQSRTAPEHEVVDQPAAGADRLGADPAAGGTQIVRCHLGKIAAQRPQQ